MTTSTINAPRSLEEMLALLGGLLVPGVHITFKDPETVIQYVFVKLWSRTHQGLKTGMFFEQEKNCSITAFPVKLTQEGPVGWIALKYAHGREKLQNVVLFNFDKPTLGKFAVPEGAALVLGVKLTDREVGFKKEECLLSIPADMAKNDLLRFVETEIMALLQRIPNT
jgi:hypothetical protein